MRRLSKISLILCSLGASPFFLQPDTGGGSGGASNLPQPPEPTGETGEEKLSSAKSIISDFFKQLSGAFRERDEAQSALTSEQTAHTETKDALATAQSDLVTANNSLGAAYKSMRESLGFTDEQMNSFKSGDVTVVASAVKTLADRKAVEIAASQGVPPVVTAPDTASDGNDEISILREQASATADPIKRAQLHARASALVAQKKSKSQN